MNSSFPSNSVFVEPPALVSVLIRTMGRETLIQSVNSVVQQSFTAWHIVIVNAQGQDLPVKSSLEENHRITWLDYHHSLDRSAAANMLLDAINTPFAIFLDDDDWFLPDHLEKLVSVLQSDVSLVAAYSDVKTSGGKDLNQTPSHIFASEFDAVRLQIENYLPIHSILFCSDAIAQAPACRFDENLKLFEDWDFWIQLAARGVFRRAPGVSAVYALNPESGSGHTHTEQRQTMLQAIARKQLDRWNPDQVVDIMEMLAHKARDLNQAQQEFSLAQKAQELTRQEFADLRQFSAQLQQELVILQELRVEHLLDLERLNNQLSALYQSRSWRSTRPLRGASRLLHRIRSKLAKVRIHTLLRNGLQAARMEIRRHGWVGFMRRFPYYLGNVQAQMTRLTSDVPIGQPADFHAPAPKPRDIRLHPDLSVASSSDTLDAKVSVVIPTLNAGIEFPWMLRKLRAQKGVREIQIVVVDSGSNDQTVEWAQAAGCTVVEILPSEFSHSYARNRGADAGSGDYLLFMVQDAYPIGDRWMYGMLRYLLDHADQKVMAASCAEYSRSDSDMMYDAMVNTHYRFLGCLDYDRIGEYSGDDHMSLRSRGQLSDVSCLISRPCFMQYRYRGDYAEDLDLGIRLIKDGYRVAMLASVKVIHSHNRPAYYYLKRTFVDVIFLVGMFDDFTYPRCESPQGLLAGIVSTARHVSDWLRSLEGEILERSLGTEINIWIRWARQGLYIQNISSILDMGDARLNDFIKSLEQDHLPAVTTNMDAAVLAESKRFADSFLARLDHFNQFAAAVYGPQDSRLRHELCDVVRKTFAATAGGALGFFYLDYHTAEHGTERAMADAFARELKAGV